MMTYPQGKKCQDCGLTEASCAFKQGCCGGCSHFAWLDPAGNEPLSSAGGRRRLPVEHGTNRGWFQHRVRHESPCFPCRLAHSEANRRVAS